jgi:hypothetical protein
MVEQEVAFVSGPLDISIEEYDSRYYLRVVEAIKKKHHFVIGDGRGCDAFTQQILSNFKYPHVTIFHMFKKPRHLAEKKWKVMGGYRTDIERDEAMTKNSTYDIAVPRTIEEQKKIYGSRYRPRKSGTQKNLERRTNLKS